VCIAGFAINTNLLRFFDGDELAYLFVWLLSIPLLTGFRVLSRAVAARTALWGVPAVIFGEGIEARRLVDRLLLCPWIGYRPSLIVLDAHQNGSHYRGIPVIYGLSPGVAFAARHHFSTALMSMPTADRVGLKAVLQVCAREFPAFILFGELLAFAATGTQVRDFEGIIGLYTTKKLLNRLNGIAKRLFDLLGVIIGGIAIMPFLLLIGLVIKLDSPGPVFYKHRRIAKGGKEFLALKFRSMVADADKQLSAFLEEPKHLNEWSNNHKIKNDPRITNFGRFLRRSSLDELPQLWNVLRGEMSLIGPRPIVKSEISKYGEAWEEVSRVLPGMSGLWQVSGRSDRGYGERVALDKYYIQNWSMWLDGFILAKSLWMVIAGKGVY